MSPYSVAKISLLCSTMNCTARFLACMSVISLSRLWSRMILGANTTAKFFGDICCACQLLYISKSPEGAFHIPDSPALDWQLEQDET